MKRYFFVLICIFLICNSTIIFCQYAIPEVIIDEGGTPDERQKIEFLLSTVLTTINQEAAGVASIYKIREYFTEYGFTSIKKLVRNEKIYSTFGYQRASLAKLRNSDQFEVRGIRVNVGAYSRDDKKTIEYLVFIISSDFLVMDVNYSLENHQYRKLIDFGEKPSNDQTIDKIVKFLEKYKTAYKNKDILFLEKVLSDNALIIVGFVEMQIVEEKQISENKKYSIEKINRYRRSKKEFINNLKNKVFSRNTWIKIDFSDIQITQHRTIPDLYGVKLFQNFKSQYYSDSGNLFLLFDFKNPDSPIIYVRVWQKNKYPDGNFISLYDFIIES